MVFRRQGDRIMADFIPLEHQQGFPGVLHGGVIATLLDETMSRTGALRREWLVTARLDIRYRWAAAIGPPLRVRGDVARQRMRPVRGGGSGGCRYGAVGAGPR